LRAYRSLEDLVELDEQQPARADDPKGRKGEPTTYTALPIRWEQIEDHPSRDDIPPEVGGWPLCVQSEVQWSGLDGVEFALQIDGDNRFGFEVGYGGVFYKATSAPATAAGSRSWRTHAAAGVSGKLTRVSSSESSHSRRAVSSSLAAPLRPTSVGWPRLSWKPSGPT
jgi:hypothetical protein